MAADDAVLGAHDLILAGLPSRALQHMVERVGLLRRPEAFEKAVGMSLRTYQRRKEKPDAPLSPEQGGRAWTFAELLSTATRVFGDQAEAERWFERPALALDGRRPLDLLETSAGVRSVEQLLGRIEYGVYT
jgi:putative toxin-antitoxin system antitoxin component (TIGR02293 family)